MTETKNIPQSLRDSAVFCVWKLEQRNGKPTKVPYDPLTGMRAKSNNINTFSDFGTAEQAQERYSGMGVGIFGSVCAIDIDHCVEDGVINDFAQDIIARMCSYTEISPSGTGIHIFFSADGFQYDKTKYYINNQKIGLEVYTEVTQKYVTLTGNIVESYTEFDESGEQLQGILDEFMLRNPSPPQSQMISITRESLDDQKLIDKMCSKNGDVHAIWVGQWHGLYQSQSEADQALCNRLAFWTAKDSVKMDRLFRQSGLMREKWDRAQSGSTYGQITIDKAILDCTQVYDPQAYFAKQIASAAVDFGEGEGEKTLVDLKPDTEDRYTCSEMGNGYLFADWYKNKARYVAERKMWYIYDGTVWREDIGNLQVMELAKELGKLLVMYALSINDDKRKREYIDYVNKWNTRRTRETVLKDASSVYPLSIEDFDKDPFLFNCLNGTLDLKTREFLPHNPNDFLSKISGVSYDPDAKAERWEQFIDEIMCGDKEKAVFLQKALGYALTGDTSHECLFIIYGPSTRNGKSTAMNTFMTLVGDYGKSTNPDTITMKPVVNGNAASEDIARLDGVRFVNVSEPEKALQLSTALVKTLSGQDPIRTRFLYEGSFDLYPQFKLFINTNHLPRVSDVTLFSSDRVKVIPFERHFTDKERDPSLKNTLKKPKELSGILNWCLEGWWLLNETGLDVPQSVRDATDEYKRDSDKIGRFLEDTVVRDIDGEVRTSALYQLFTVWCFHNGYKADSIQSFSKAVGDSTKSTVRKRPKDGSSVTTLLVGYSLIANSHSDFGKNAI